MYLSEIAIKDFRLFDDLQVVLNPGINLIVGENNSGKTALVDAIRYALTVNSGEWIRVQERDFRKGTTSFSIRLKFDGLEPHQAGVFVEHLTHQPVAGGASRKSVLFLNLLGEQTDELVRGARLIRTEVRSGELADGPAIERDVREYLAATYLRPLRDAEDELMGGRGSRLAQILGSSGKFGEAAVVEQLLTAMITANKEIVGNEGVAAARDRIEVQLRELDFRTSPLSPLIAIMGGTDLAQLSPAERKQMFRAILERLQLLIDEEERYQGLGYSNLLFMATELLLLKQEQLDFPLLLIEEPEAHLHPQLQMKFLKALRQGFGGTGKPVLQSILTTHSPNLASKAPLESLLVMSGGRAFSLRKDETELDAQNYIYLEKFLDVTKANLFFAKGVVVVEGDGENILLSTLADLLGIPLEDYGVSVVNVGSVAFAHFARIFRRKGLDDPAHAGDWLATRVVCLRDLDLWPEGAKRDAANPYGFRDWKQKNQQYWETHYAGNPAGRVAWIDAKKAIAGQNVRVEVSDHWTFEYALIRAGLATEVFEALYGATDGFAELPADDEARAIAIYSEIATRSGAKTEVAHALAALLMQRFGRVITPPVDGEVAEQKAAREAADDDATLARRADLRSRVPAYIVRALEYATGAAAPAAAAVAV